VVRMSPVARQPRLAELLGDLQEDREVMGIPVNRIKDQAALQT
jgi:hypothetical protein